MLKLRLCVGPWEPGDHRSDDEDIRPILDRQEIIRPHPNHPYTRRISEINQSSCCNKENKIVLAAANLRCNIMYIDPLT